MGLFSSKPKANLPKTSDKVWKTRSACLKGIATEGLSAIRDSEAPVIITFFEASFRELTGFFESQKVPFHFEGNPSIDSIKVINQNHTLISSTGATSAPKIKGLLLGRYPFSPYEDKVLESLYHQFPAPTFTFCHSLDDPFFEQFGSQNIKQIMDQLGMKDDEFIEHAMVSKAIKTALEKINKKVTVEMKAKSEREWFNLNIRPSA